MATCDVDQNTFGAAQADLVEKRICNRFLGSLCCTIFAIGFARTHHGFAHFVHHGANVCKVEVDKTRTYHQVCNALNTLIKNIICEREGVSKCCFFSGNAEQVLVWNDDQRINNFLQRLYTIFSLTHALCALKLERLRDDADGQNAKFARGLCNNRSSARARAAAHTRSDEAHVCSREVIDDLLNALFGSGCADGCLRACAKTFGNLDPKLHLASRLALLKRLRVSIGNHEVYAFELLVDHVVNRVTASATDAKNGDPWFEVFLTGHCEIECHNYCPPDVFVRLRGCDCCLFRPISTAPFPYRHVKNGKMLQNIVDLGGVSAVFRLRPEILRNTIPPAQDAKKRTSNERRVLRLRCHWALLGLVASFVSVRIKFITRFS